MRTTLKLAACLLFIGAVTTAFAQQQTTTKKKEQTKKHKSKKEKTGIDNKIAVSDQAQPADKSSKNKKESGISNK